MIGPGLEVMMDGGGPAPAPSRDIPRRSASMNTEVRDANNHRSPAIRRARQAALAMVLMAGGFPAIASPLAVHADGASGNRFEFRVANDSSNRMDRLRFHAADDYAISCAAQTTRGLSFLDGGSLQAGDHIDCEATFPTDAKPRSGGFAVSAHERGGRVHVRNVTFSTRGVTTPDQGFLVLVGGGVHNDTSADGLLDAGELIDYHYTLVNLGSLPLSGIAVTDIAGAVTCPQSTLAVGASMACTRTYAITPANAAAHEVLNEVEVSATDSLGGAVAGGDVVLHLDLQARAGIRVFKSPLLLHDSDGNGFVSPDDEIFYTFVIKNSNAEALSGVDLVELGPALINGGIACEATTLGGQPFAGLGSGQLGSQDVVLCSASYTVQASDGVAGQVANIVEASGFGAIAGRVQGTGAALLLLPGQSALLLTKSAEPLMFLPGGVVTYTIEVTNAGSLPLANVQLSDPLPAGVESFEWTCAGAWCPNGSGNGAINELIPDLPIGAQLVYTVAAQLRTNPPAAIVNTVSATPGSIVRCAPSGSPPPCSADAVVRQNYNAIPMPIGGPWVVLLMVLGMVLVATRLRF
jgi:uncharacterized repeat protein (TIGR01451 family)